MTDEIDDTTLEGALRAPGSPAELADEKTYRAMFREAQSAAGAPPGTTGVVASGPRSVARRVGAGSALAVVIAVASTGVAAAYSANLPAPVQRAVHSVLAPVGVPAAAPERPVARTPERAEPEAPTTSSVPSTTSPASTPSATASVRTLSPSSAPVAEPAESAAAPVPPASPVDVPPTETSAVPASPATSPSASPSESVSPSEPAPDSASSSPSQSPSSSPTSASNDPTPSGSPLPEPATASIVSAGANNKVAPGGTAVVTGRVKAEDGSPVPDQRVILQVRGADGWRRLAVARTAADGSVSVATPPLQRSTKVRLRAGNVPSAAWRIVVQPSLTASTTTVDGIATVTATAAGGQAGDRVLLLTRVDGLLVQVGPPGSLSSTGGVGFELPAPTTDQTYVVRLPATAAHAGTQVTVVVTP